MVGHKVFYSRHDEKTEMMISYGYIPPADL